MSLCSILPADTRALSLRLFSEIATVYLNQGQFEQVYQKVTSKPLEEIITQILLPSKLILSLFPELLNLQVVFKPDDYCIALIIK